jgi:acetyl esterase/lipase
MLRKAVTGKAWVAGIVVILLAACSGSDATPRASSTGSTESTASTESTGSTASKPPAPPSEARVRCPAPPAPTLDVAYETVRGVDPNLLSLDVHPTAKACPAPVVVWVHGGGWRVGDKRNQLTRKVRLWNDAGYVVVSVNYRLTDPAAAHPVQWPTHDEDVGAAIGWVHREIGRYGGDPERIAILGHSAGAQIVASIGTDPRYLAAQGLGLDALRCVGALDTEGYDVATRAGAGVGVYVDAFGTDPGRWAEASPINHVAAGRGIPPFLVVERGTPRRRATTEAFVAKLRDAGVDVTVVDAGALTHGQVNSEIGRPGETVMTPPVEAFLARCFAG